MQVPFSMKPTQYGEIFSKVEIDGITKTVAYANGLTYFIDSTEDTNNVHIPSPVDLKWTDTKINDTPTFI